PRRDSPGGDQHARTQARSRRPFGGDRRRDRRSDGGRHRRQPAQGMISIASRRTLNGYSSAGCSPAEPASASPVTDNNRPIPIQRANQIALLNFTAGMQANSRSSGSGQRG